MGRFIQPDTIVPEPGEPQSLDRHSYMLNGPLRYLDPTGRYTAEETRKQLEDTCGDEWERWCLP